MGRGSRGGAPPGGEGKLLPEGGRVAGQARAGRRPQESPRLHGLLLLLLLGLLLPHLHLAADKAHLLRGLLLLLLCTEGTLHSADALSTECVHLVTPFGGAHEQTNAVPVTAGR